MRTPAEPKEADMAHNVISEPTTPIGRYATS